MLLILTTTLFVYSAAFAVTVWKWIDKSGTTHYSDQPIPGAVQVDLNAQTYEAADATITPAARAPTPNKKAQATAYQSIEVARPTNDETISNTAGQLFVSLRVAPGVQPGHSVQLSLDGKLVSEPNSEATDFTLKDIARGSHTLSASVVTRDGQILIQSPSVTFFVQQPSLLLQKKK